MTFEPDSPASGRPGSAIDLSQALGLLLHDPVAAMRAGTARLLLAAAAGFALYGLGAGSWQGGSTHVLAAVKAPLIAIASLALCTPSLWVVLSLRGARLEPRAFAHAIAAFAAVLAIVLAALLPIAWLFSVSTGSLGFLVLLHAALWVFALGLGRAKLKILMAAAGAPALAPGWLLLLLLVSLQMTTSLRPVLEQAPQGPLFEGGRLSFLTHLGRTLDGR